MILFLPPPCPERSTLHEKSGTLPACYLTPLCLPTQCKTNSCFSMLHINRDCSSTSEMSLAQNVGAYQSQEFSLSILQSHGQDVGHSVQEAYDAVTLFSCDGGSKCSLISPQNLEPNPWGNHGLIPCLLLGDPAARQGCHVAQL